MSFLKALHGLFYPHSCLVCGEPISDIQKIICTTCRHKLPETHHVDLKNNSMEKSLEGRIPIVQAMALLYYKKKGGVQQLIHALKYKNRQDVGIFFAKWMATEIMQSHRFSNIDVIVMVPLHASRLKQRGYNQLSLFSKTLSEELGIPWVQNILIKTYDDQTHSKKGRLGRFEKINERFQLSDYKALSGKHILLLDDVYTTGATVEACSNELLKTPGTSISIATISISDY